MVGFAVLKEEGDEDREKKRAGKLAEPGSYGVPASSVPERQRAGTDIIPLDPEHPPPPGSPPPPPAEHRYPRSSQPTSVITKGPPFVLGAKGLM